MTNAEIKMLVMDVDGTLTDGKVYMGSDGEVMKAFDIKDGYAIKNILIPAGVCPAIISGRKSKITENRCRELSISGVYQGVKDKLWQLKSILLENCIDGASVAYIGDDLNDLECMQYVKSCGGTVGCPADAVAQVVEIADFVSEREGGNGAVREFIEWLLAGQV